MPQPASPVLLGGDNGLELRWWVTSAEAGPLSAALLPYAERPLPIDKATRDLLAANGLRIIAVPLEKLEAVQSALGVRGAEQRQWLGQVPAWMDAINGPQRDDGITLAMHDGPLRLGPGRLRLLVRCWTVPVPPGSSGGGAAGPSGGAALHVEIAPQHRETGPGSREVELRLTPPSVAPEAQGLVFTRLLTRFSASEGDAYLIVPETPGVVWTIPAAAPAGEEPPAAPPVAEPPPPRIGQVSRRGTDTGTTAAANAAPAGPSSTGGGRAAAAVGPAGPPSDPNPSLGEAMLMSVAERPAAPGEASAATTPRTVRAIVLLIPRVPERFELIGR